MEDIAELGMEAIGGPITDHYDQILHPQRAAREYRNRRSRDSQNGDDRRDSQAPRNGHGRRPGMNRRTSSVDRDYGQRRRGDRRSDSSSSSSSLSSISSSEEKRRMRRTKGKEILTAGFAAVATISAAQKVWQTYEARKQHHRDVLEGRMTKHEAKKKRNTARVQDAAAIAIAAMGVHGMMGDWKEVKENHHEYNKHANERHQRRDERLRNERSRSGHRNHRRSEPDLRRR